MELFESPAPSPSQIMNGVREEVTECESNQRLENIYHLREWKKIKCCPFTDEK